MKIEPFTINMSIDERDAKIRTILEEELLPLGRKKSADYGGKDCFGNLRKAGWIGTIIRTGDKTDRLMNLITSDKQEVLDESIEDTIIDAINYLFFSLIMKREAAVALASVKVMTPVKITLREKLAKRDCEW